MVHDHYFRTLADGITEMRDVYRFTAPLSILGRVAEVLFLRRYMQALLRERVNVIRDIAHEDCHSRG
jgi:hypothetical protein